jgi:hypothetical protein
MPGGQCGNSGSCVVGITGLPSLPIAKVGCVVLFVVVVDDLLPIAALTNLLALFKLRPPRLPIIVCSQRKKSHD